MSVSSKLGLVAKGGQFLFERSRGRKDGMRYLAQTLGEIPGVPAKFSQFFAQKAGLDPDELRQPDPMGVDFVWEVLCKEQPQWSQSLFKDELEFVATASVGEVYRLRTRSHDLAIKFRYPGVVDDMESQWTDLLSLHKWFRSMNKFGFRREEYQEFFIKKWKEEANYLTEGKNQEEFRVFFDLRSDIVVPKVYSEFSTEKMLVQNFEESSLLRDTPPEHKDGLSESLVYFALHSLFVHRIVHSDFHPRNLGQREGKLVVYDFGSTVRLTEKKRDSIWYLLFCAVDPKEVLVCLIDLDFDSEKVNWMGSELGVAVLQLLQSFRGMHDQSKEIESLLGAKKWTARLAGPPEFLLLMRSFWGLSKAAEELGVAPPWFDVARKLAQENGWPAPSALDSRSLVKHVPSASGLNLKVKVVREGSVVVELEMPLNAVDRLETLLPDDVAARLSEQGIDVHAIKRESQKNGYRAGTLFEQRLEEKVYKVWIG